MIHVINKEEVGLRVHHISDSHMQHEGLIFPDNIDVLIHSGDATNYRDLAMNSNEWDKFLEWYANLPIPIKIFVPGNHDATCSAWESKCKKRCKDLGIEYLNKSSFSVYGIHFYGDPMTPHYNDWYFTADRQKLHKHWDLIPEETNVLITHGPRKGMLDLSYHGSDLEFCGDSALGKRIDKLENLSLHCFGHIHDSNGIVNVGVRESNGVFYSNASGVKDGKINSGIHYHGNTFEL